MRLGFTLAAAILLLTSVPMPAADPVWVQVTSPHFKLYTDTTEVKGRRLLSDFESRVAALSDVFGEVPQRQFPIEVFLFSRREDFIEAAPRPTGPDAARGFEKSAYLWRGPDRIFVATLDKSPADIADDVGHAIGHVFFERYGRWRPFWLAEAAGEHFRKVGRNPDNRRINEKEGYPVADLLEIIPAKDYDDDAEPTAFRIQSYRIFRVILARHVGEFRAYLKSLASTADQEPTFELDVEALQAEFDAYTETTVTPRSVATSAITDLALTPAAMAVHRGDLLLAANKPSDASPWYKGEGEDARAARAILPRFSIGGSNALPGLARTSSDLPRAGLVHFHFGSIETQTPEEIERQAQALQQAIEVLPRFGRAHAQLARVMTLLGKHEEALVEIDRALELEPEFADEFHLIQAEAYLGLHRYGEANAAARLAAALPHSRRGVDYDSKSSEMVRRVDEVRREVEGRRLQQIREEVGALVSRREPPPPPPPPPPPQRFGKIDYDVQANRQIAIVDAPLPLYPDRLVQRGVTGNVTVRAAIGANGKVTQATLVDSQIPDMNAGAIDAVKKWTFQPLTGAASVEVRIVFRFGVQ
jgi:TonB family protein